MEKHRNLYKFSQQGWEALNQKIKHFYFHNTNHGGSKGNGGKSADEPIVVTGDHIKPIMRMLSRYIIILWRLGLGDIFFLQKDCVQQESKETSGMDDVPMNSPGVERTYVEFPEVEGNGIL